MGGPEMEQTLYDPRWIGFSGQVVRRR